jgi:hypothetical protein
VQRAGDPEDTPVLGAERRIAAPDERSRLFEITISGNGVGRAKKNQ